MVIVHHCGGYFQHDFSPRCHLFRFWIPPVPQLNNRSMLQILVNIFQSSKNIVKCYRGVKWQDFFTSPSKAIFENNAVIAQSLQSSMSSCFGKIMSNPLFQVFYINLYTPTSSLGCMALLKTSPTSFLGEVQFFFSGLTAEPTYWLTVWHSNPNTPL